MHYTPKTGLRITLLIGTVALAAFNFAGIARADNVETVVVTGSRIPQANLQSVSPILGVAAKEFQQKGVTDVADYLNDLPQTFVSNVADFTNANNPLSAPGGITTVDLRGQRNAHLYWSTVAALAWVIPIPAIPARHLTSTRSRYRLSTMSKC